MEDKIILHEENQLMLPYCYLTENKMGLIIDKNISHNQILEIGRRLKMMEGTVQFWIGDWINANWGEYEHGKYDEAENLGFKKQTLKNYAIVSKKILSKVRFSELTHAHHCQVAFLSLDQQEYWLQKAIENKWTVLQLREAIKRDKNQYLWLKFFDIWNFQGKDELGQDYPGNIPSGIILNTLYYYTEEDDLIVDPMAGGGLTVDCCKYLNRRCLAYDIKPIRSDIKQNDLLGGYPKETIGCNLIFMDPPYYKKKEEEYGDVSISALNKVEYLKTFDIFAEKSLKILKPNGFLAFLMEPYIDYKQSENSIWLYEYIFRFINKGWIVERIFDVPESSQRYQAHVKEDKIYILKSQTDYADWLLSLREHKNFLQRFESYQCEDLINKIKIHKENQLEFKKLDKEIE